RTRLDLLLGVRTLPLSERLARGSGRGDAPGRSRPGVDRSHGGSVMRQKTEAWLTGPIEGIDPYLMPVAHALVQASRDLERAASELSPEELWARPGGAASIGFHLRHIAGVLDRLLTYARGEMLT